MPKSPGRERARPEGRVPEPVAGVELEAGSFQGGWPCLAVVTTAGRRRPGALSRGHTNHRSHHPRQPGFRTRRFSRPAPTRSRSGRVRFILAGVAPSVVSDLGDVDHARLGGDHSGLLLTWCRPLFPSAVQGTTSSSCPEAPHAPHRRPAGRRNPGITPPNPFAGTIRKTTRPWYVTSKDSPPPSTRGQISGRLRLRYWVEIVSMWTFYTSWALQVKDFLGDLRRIPGFLRTASSARHEPPR